ncbi:MAG: glycoside hydrolase family 32 protein, partial [Bryobacteraceae bacterium]
MSQSLSLARVPFLLICAFGGLSGQNAIAPQYDQPYRPQYHFSPREHWTNDPNGLVYFEGEYHLFFQYNPFGDNWGHMSWGHAVSRDLLHWEQLPVALPEEGGIMIFTGSTVIDRRNTSGFCSGGKACLVAVYTGHTPESGSRPALQTQNLAYSNDRGRTWTKYRGNPILDLHMTDFRDPKVFWSDQSKQWVMAVSLPNDHKVRLYGSPDLKRWQALSDFGPAGATGGQWECPELFELPVKGGNHDTRWVLKIGLNPGAVQGGSGEQYFIGRFDGTRFTNENPASLTLWTDYGKDCYCSLTFNGLSATQARVMLGWMDNWQYAGSLPTSPWRGQMTIPRKLSLRRMSEGLRLVQEPIDALQELRGAPVEIRGKTTMKSRTFELRSEIPMGNAREVGWRVLHADGSSTLVGYDRGARKLFVDRTHSGLVGFSKDFPARVEAPLSISGNVLRLNLLVDRCSVEVFADDGHVAMTNLVFPPRGAMGLEMY